jgi:hypothetical protein
VRSYDGFNKVEETGCSETAEPVYNVTNSHPKSKVDAVPKPK